MIDILIADDQTLMRDGLQTILNLEDDMRVVGAARNGEEALRLTAELKPHVVLMDIQMPVMNGIECTKRIKQLYPETVILILTTFTEDDYIIDALASGAIGFLLKDMPGDKLIQSIHDALGGHFMLPSVIASKLAGRLALMNNSPQMRIDTHRLKTNGVSFTDREKSIVLLMLEGKTNREIAELLLMREGTVKNYVSSIYNKVGTNDRTLAVIALKDLMRDA